MPLTEKNLEYDGSMDFGMLMCENDQDEALLSHISPYTTLRAADLKRGTGPTHKTLQDVLANWKKDLTRSSFDKTSTPDDERLREEALSETCLQEHELLVQGKITSVFMNFSSLPLIKKQSLHANLFLIDTTKTLLLIFSKLYVTC